MAKIKNTSIAENVRGSIGALTYQLWRPGINIVRTKPTSIHNPSSGNQQRMRLLMNFYSNAWRAQLTDEERATWNTYALLQRGKATGDHGTRAIIRGNTGAGNGFNYFVGLHCRKTLIIFPPSINEDAPIAEALPDNNTNYAVIYDGAPGNDITVTWDESAQHAAGAYTRIWLWNPTRTYHKQMVSFALTTAETVNFSEAKSANGVPVRFMMLAAGTPLLLQMDVMNPSGQISPPSETFEIETVV
ncbi:hypothetical protein ES708_26093 [subsurface metagenome]